MPVPDNIFPDISFAGSGDLLQTAFLKIQANSDKTEQVFQDIYGINVRDYGSGVLTAIAFNTALAKVNNDYVVTKILVPNEFTSYSINNNIAGSNYAVWHFEDGCSLNINTGYSFTINKCSNFSDNMFSGLGDVSFGSEIKVIDTAWWTTGTLTNAIMAKIKIACGTTARKVIFSSPWTMNASMDLGQYIIPEFNPGAIINVSSYDLNINIKQPFSYQIFSITTGNIIPYSVIKAIPEMFGAISVGFFETSASDSTISIQKCLDGFGSCILQNKRTYGVTSVVLKNNRDVLKGEDGLSRLLYIGNTTPSTDIIVIDKDIYNSGVMYNGQKIENITVDGNGNARWCLNLNGLGSNGILNNILATYSVGMIKGFNCYYSNWDNIICWGNVDGSPAGFDLDDWKAIHNGVYSGVIWLNEANTLRIGSLHVGQCGTSNIPNTATKTNNLIYASGDNLVIEALSFESTRGFLNQTNSVGSLFKQGYSTEVLIESMFLENVFCDRIVLTAETAGNLTIDSLYVGGSSGIAGSPFYHTSRNNLSVNSVNLNEYKYIASPFIYSSNQGNCYGKIAHNTSDKPIDIGGNYYHDLNVGFILGSSSVYTKGNNIPTIRSGMSVANGSDANGSYIIIATGDLKGIDGDSIFIGNRGSDDNMYATMLRPVLPADNWNVCIDTRGGSQLPFLERQSSIVQSLRNGKVILATFTTDSSNVISSLTATNNTYEGMFINSNDNKITSGSGAPTSGKWQKGDYCINTNVTSLGTTPNRQMISGWNCMISGSPGTWDQSVAVIGV